MQLINKIYFWKFLLVVCFRVSVAARMAESENKGSVQHTPAEWEGSNQDQCNNADRSRYQSKGNTC